MASRNGRRRRVKTTPPGLAESKLSLMSKTAKEDYLANPDDYDLSIMVPATGGLFKGKITRKELEAARRA